MGKPYKCGEIAFTLDFSKVNLVRGHRDVLKQIAESSAAISQPIDLTVQGYFARRATWAAGS